MGCGGGRPPLYPVSGVVEFDTGEPVRNASIEFVPSTAGPSPRSLVDAEGNFTLGTYASYDGAPAGEYRVVVAQVVVPDAAEHLGDLGQSHADHARGVKVVALKHASPDTSGVKVEVEPVAQNELTIVVEAR